MCLLWNRTGVSPHNISLSLVNIHVEEHLRNQISDLWKRVFFLFPTSTEMVGKRAPFQIKGRFTLEFENNFLNVIVSACFLTNKTFAKSGNKGESKLSLILWNSRDITVESSLP